MAKDNPSIEDLLIDNDAKGSQAILEKKIRSIKQSDKEKIIKAKAAELNLPYIDLTGFPITPEALSVLERKQATALNSVVFFFDEREIRVATTEPKNSEVNEYLEKLKELYNANVELYLTSQHSLEFSLSLYDHLPKIREIKTGVTITEQDLNKWQKEISDFPKLQQAIQKVNLTEIVTIIIASALQAEASDIHVEAEETDIKIRFRIDGVLNNVATLPPALWRKVVSRIKLLSHLKINIANIPQDGRFTIHLQSGDIEVRVSTVPTSFGESVAMRLLKSSAAALQFDDLGLAGQAYALLEQEIKKPNGMILTTGPTGSGKTTTLYAILNKLNDEATKIITIEDPIEYKLKGVNQSQVNKAKDYTFANGLKYLLRQDPDIVMVGEIRDAETADISINAALTGHLVVSTLHTNSAAGAIPRFLAMGAKPYLLAPALNAVIGQRLVRRLCKHCKQEVKIDTGALNKVKNIINKLPASAKRDINPDKLVFYSASGCSQCNDIGFKGMTGIFEIMIMNEAIEKLILAGEATENQLQKLAADNQMVTMVQDGLLKALKGITSVEEVFKKAE